jgi:DUF917 family protein
MKKINQTDINTMLLGAGIYGTGGGFPLEVQRQIFQKLNLAGKEFRLVEMEELTNNDFVCTAYGVGSAANTEVDLSESLTKGLVAMQQLTGKKFKAIFAGEINIEALVFQAASSLNLPVLDADCTGGRAVPEIQFDNLFVKGKSILPLVAVSQKGEVFILEKAKTAEEIEKFVRQIAQKTNNSVAVIDHPMSIKEALKNLETGTITRSIKIGRLLAQKNKTLTELLELTQGTALFEGTIISNKLKDQKTGFLEGYYEIEDHQQDLLKILVKNENLIALKNQEVLLTIPDLISVLDQKTLLALHNSQITPGQKVVVLGIRASSTWRSRKGKELFSPKNLGLDYPVKLIK